MTSFGVKGFRLVWKRQQGVMGRLNVHIEILGMLCLGRRYAVQLVKLPDGRQDDAKPQG